MKRDDCDGVTLEELCAWQEEPLNREAALAALNSLIARGLVTECPDHPRHYRIPGEQAEQVHRIISEYQGQRPPGPRRWA